MNMYQCNKADGARNSYTFDRGYSLIFRLLLFNTEYTTRKFLHSQRKQINGKYAGMI